MEIEFIAGLGTGMLLGLGILVLLIISFIIWQFITMLRSNRIRATEKGVWTILFIMFSLLTAIVWFFAKRLKK